MVKAQRKIAQETCIFCGKGGTPGNPITPEHLWSDWMAEILSPMLPEDKDPEHTELYRRTRQGTVLVDSGVSNVRGRAHRHKKIKAVCKLCNGGWMSIIEDATKPYLIPLIRGEATLLDWRARQMLTDWITLKLFIAEFNTPGDQIYGRYDREYFMGWRVIPEYIRIWIGKHSSPLKWKTGIFRQSAGLAPAGVPLPPRPRPINAQTLTLGIGELLIHLTATSFAATYSILDTLGGDTPRCRLLWPIGGHNIRWPPFSTITEADADQIATDLDRILLDPGIFYVDD
jgi:hypothetical protein